jgi:hypothetical protein
MQTIALTDAELETLAPAIFATRRSATLSEKYQQVRTIDAINALRTEGWQPVSAQQKGSRRGPATYAKHLVRLRHVALAGIFTDNDQPRLGQAFPELVISNSHNGSSTYQLLCGIHVVACSNGLIVADSVLASIRVRHLQSNMDELLSAATKIGGAVGPVAERVAAMSGVTLSAADAESFAAAALTFKFPAGNSPFEPQHVLQPRRALDDRKDLWAVFNNVQENLMKGGLVGQSQSGRQYTSRPVADINVHVNFNQQLWALADDYLERLAA